MQIMDRLMQEKLIAVIRAKDQDMGYHTAKAVMSGGLKAIEVTFTIPQAELLIARLKDEFKHNILLGAGTILNVDMCKKAIAHGAEYIVSPGFDAKTATYCYQKGIPYVPGCMTVTEMMTAMKYHTNFIKLFPGNHFKTTFIKSIKAPLPNLKVMVTGGVNLDNIKDWLANGADIIGIGSAITKYQKTQNFEKMTETVSQYIKRIKDVTSCVKSSP